MVQISSCKEVGGVNQHMGGVLSQKNTFTRLIIAVLDFILQSFIRSVTDYDGAFFLSQSNIILSLTRYMIVDLKSILQCA